MRQERYRIEVETESPPAANPGHGCGPPAKASLGVRSLTYLLPIGKTSQSMPPANDQSALLSLRQKCQSIQLRFLKMYYQAGAGHVGASLSCAEILTFLRFAWMKPEDEFLLSKGHAAAALYSVLAENNQIPEESVPTFYQDGTLLAAHPSPSSMPGIRFATGSLGHGLSLCAGLALANQLAGQKGNIYCVSSCSYNFYCVWEKIN